MNPKLNNKEMECIAPLNDYCSPEETYPDCKNCKYYKFKKITLMKTQLIFKWYDIWIGFFYDQKKKWLYFFPIPMCGIILKFK